MKNILITTAAAVACLTSIGARAQDASIPYRFYVNWSGYGFDDSHRGYVIGVPYGGRAVITTPSEEGVFSGTSFGVEYTISVRPDISDPEIADAVVSGSIGQIYFSAASGSTGFSGDYALEGGVGNAEISFGTPIPEPTNTALLLGGLGLFGALGRKRKSVS